MESNEGTDNLEELEPVGDTARDEAESIKEQTSNVKSNGQVETIDSNNELEGETKTTIDDELEEGELKDDDDDDDDDYEDENSTKKHGEDSLSVKSEASSISAASSKQSKTTKNDRKSSVSSVNNSAKISSSSPSGSSNGSNSSGSSSDSSSATSSDSSSSRSSDNESSSKQSIVRSQQSRNRHSSPNQHARLVSMRAKLLEARSREIEMKFQKNRPTATPSSMISALSTTDSASTTVSTLKTTVAKPSITYAENPNPSSPEPFVAPIEKKSKKRKKKSSSKKKKKKKRRKTSESPRKKTTSKSEDPPDPLPFDIDKSGPRTPPDNQVLNINDQQIEWPSYLIKMTIAQPSISYSVNPASVMETAQPTPSNGSADLNFDYQWYYNYFLGMEMSKAQAHHQACSVVISSGSYEGTRLDRFLEQRGFIRQANSPKSDVGDTDKQKYNNDQNLQLRSNEPAITTLRLNREIILPNGKVLPRGTIQKIVHPFPRAERVAPDIRTPFFDLN